MKKRLFCALLALLLALTLPPMGALAADQGAVSGSRTYTADEESTFTYTPGATGWYSITASCREHDADYVDVFDNDAIVSCFSWMSGDAGSNTVIAYLTAGHVYTVKAYSDYTADQNISETLTVTGTGVTAQLAAGQSASFSGGRDECRIFGFTPQQTGFYTVSVSDNCVFDCLTTSQFDRYSYTQTNLLTAGTTYYFNVACLDGNGGSAAVKKTVPAQFVSGTASCSAVYKDLLNKDGYIRWMTNSTSAVAEFTPQQSGTYTFAMKAAGDGNIMYASTLGKQMGTLVSMIVYGPDYTELSEGCYEPSQNEDAENVYHTDSVSLLLDAGKTYYIELDTFHFGQNAEIKVTADSGSAGGTLPFTDVSVGDWFYQSVQYAYNNKLFSGATASTFEPYTTMSRAMLVAVLFGLDGRPGYGSAPDYADVTEDAYYYDAVAWASENGIVSGTGSGFEPDAGVTREQTAAILYKFAQFLGCDITRTGADAQNYSDYGSVSDYARPAVQWAVAAGVMAGSDGKLNPGGGANRAQVAAILRSFVENVMS